MVSTGQVRRLIPSWRWRWRAGHSIDVGARARAMVPTTQRAVMVGHVTAPAGGRRLIPRRGAAVSRRRKAAVSRRRKSRSGSHGRRRRSPRNGPADPLMDARAAGLLMPVARNRIRFIEIAIHLRQNRPDIPRPGNGPFLLERRVPGRKSVIAVGVTTCNTSRHTRDRRRPVRRTGQTAGPVTPPAASGRRSRHPAPRADPLAHRLPVDGAATGTRRPEDRGILLCSSVPSA